MLQSQRLILLVLWMVLAASPGSAQDSAPSDGSISPSSADRAGKVARNLARKQSFLMRYQFEPGEEIRWNVEHTATTNAQISGKHETTSSRTQSRKLWTITDVDSKGNFTFDHSVEWMSLWQQIGDDEPTAFDSLSSEPAPEAFHAAVQMIGKPLAVVTITPSGKVVDRNTKVEQLDFGIGDICTPMPEKAVGIGYRWYVPTTYTATDDNGRRLQLKARLHYQLTKVVDGKAYISFRTEILTPIENDKIKSQLLQKLNDGFLVFDIDRGRMVKKEIEWNEKVQEYAGPDSFLQYTGKMTETIVRPDVARAGQDRVSDLRKSSRDKAPEDQPAIRK